MVSTEPLFDTSMQLAVNFLTIFSFTVVMDKKVQLRECDGSLVQLWTISDLDRSDSRRIIRSSGGTLVKFSESN